MRYELQTPRSILLRIWEFGWMHVVRSHHHNQMKLTLFSSDTGLLGLRALWKSLHFSVSSDKCVLALLVNFIYQFGIRAAPTLVKPYFRTCLWRCFQRRLASEPVKWPKQMVSPGRASTSPSTAAPSTVKPEDGVSAFVGWTASSWLPSMWSRHLSLCNYMSHFL